MYVQNKHVHVHMYIHVHADKLREVLHCIELVIGRLTGMHAAYVHVTITFSPVGILYPE